MKVQLLGIVLYLIYLYYVRKDVDAGGPSYDPCPDMQAFFDSSVVSYNSTLQKISAYCVNKLTEHAEANASQSHEDFKAYAEVLQFNSQNKISIATYSLFDKIIAYIGGKSTQDDIANMIFGDTYPTPPLDCVSNIHDPFNAYAVADSILTESINAIIAAHKAS